MAIQQNPYPLRVDKEVMDKMKIIAREHGRSVNKEVETLMKEAIKQYESENGTISVENE